MRSKHEQRCTRKSPELLSLDYCTSESALYIARQTTLTIVRRRQTYKMNIRHAYTLFPTRRTAPPRAAVRLDSLLTMGPQMTVFRFSSTRTRSWPDLMSLTIWPWATIASLSTFRSTPTTTVDLARPLCLTRRLARQQGARREAECGHLAAEVTSQPSSKL